LTLYETRVAELVAVLAAVAGSGVVHNRSRNTVHWKAFVELFRVGDAINGWQVHRKSGGTDQERWVEVYQLDRIYGVQDAASSELAFNLNIDDVAREFIQGRALSFGHVAEGFRIIEIEPRIFGGVLCHVAECQITVSMYAANL
jgi:hypothetical protein